VASRALYRADRQWVSAQEAPILGRSRRRVKPRFHARRQGGPKGRACLGRLRRRLVDAGRAPSLGAEAGPPKRCVYDTR